MPGSDVIVIAPQTTASLQLRVVLAHALRSGLAAVPSSTSPPEHTRRAQSFGFGVLIDDPNRNTLRLLDSPTSSAVVNSPTQECAMPPQHVEIAETVAALRRKLRRDKECMYPQTPIVDEPLILPRQLPQVRPLRQIKHHNLPQIAGTS